MNAPEETAQALRDGWLYTGDVGWLDEGICLHLRPQEGDDQVQGLQFAPAELESVFSSTRMSKIVESRE